MAESDNTDNVVVELYEEDVAMVQAMDWEPEVSNSRSAACLQRESAVVLLVRAELDECIICKSGGERVGGALEWTHTSKCSPNAKLNLSLHVAPLQQTNQLSRHQPDQGSRVIRAYHK